MSKDTASSTNDVEKNGCYMEKNDVNQYLSLCIRAAPNAAKISKNENKKT